MQTTDVLDKYSIEQLCLKALVFFWNTGSDAKSKNVWHASWFGKLLMFPASSNMLLRHKFSWYGGNLLVYFQTYQSMSGIPNTDTCFSPHSWLSVLPMVILLVISTCHQISLEFHGVWSILLVFSFVYFPLSSLIWCMRDSGISLSF